jgi:hypothetical protein
MKYCQWANFFILVCSITFLFFSFKNENYFSLAKISLGLSLIVTGIISGINFLLILKKRELSLMMVSRYVGMIFCLPILGVLFIVL